MTVGGQQLPLAELVERFRFTPISGPYLKLIDWPRGAISCREQTQQIAPLFDQLVGAGKVIPRLPAARHSATPCKCRSAQIRIGLHV
jgi:hypothetical protein